MTQKKVVDERTVQEIGRVYRVAYYLFNIGLVLDLFLKLCSGSIPVGFEAFRYIGLEVAVVVLVNIVALVLLWRKGLMDDEPKYAEADKFPWKHYLMESTLCGVIVGLLSCMFRGLSGQMFSPLAYVFLFCAMVLCLVIVVMPLTYLSFRTAKRRRAQMYDHEDEEP